MGYIKSHKQQLSISLGLLALFFIFQNAKCESSTPKTEFTQSFGTGVLGEIGSTLASFTFTSTGDGAISYTVSPSTTEKDTFLIQVSSYQTVAQSSTLKVTQASNAAQYAFILSIFQGSVLPIPEADCVGDCESLNSLTLLLNGGTTTTVPSPTVPGNPATNPFETLYQFVVSQL